MSLPFTNDLLFKEESLVKEEPLESSFVKMEPIDSNTPLHEKTSNQQRMTCVTCLIREASSNEIFCIQCVMNSAAEDLIVLSSDSESEEPIRKRARKAYIPGSEREGEDEDLDDEDSDDLDEDFDFDFDNYDDDDFPAPKAKKVKKETHSTPRKTEGPAYKRGNLPFYAVCGEIPELTAAEETAANLSTIRKISKMMQHGTHERANEAEAQRALRLARQLMEQNGITDADLMNYDMEKKENLAGEMRVMIRSHLKSKIPRDEWLFTLCHTICEAFHVKYYYNHQRKTDPEPECTYVFYGVLDNVKAAGLCLEMIFNLLVNLVDEKFHYDRTSDVSKDIQRRSYLKGIAARIRKTSRNEQKEEAEEKKKQEKLALDEEVRKHREEARRRDLAARASSQAMGARIDDDSDNESEWDDGESADPLTIPNEMNRVKAEAETPEITRIKAEPLDDAAQEDVKMEVAAAGATQLAHENDERDKEVKTESKSAQGDLVIYGQNCISIADDFAKDKLKLNKPKVLARLRSCDTSSFNRGYKAGEGISLRRKKLTAE